jgi:hypothetical protein
MPEVPAVSTPPSYDLVESDARLDMLIAGLPDSREKFTRLTVAARKQAFRDGYAAATTDADADILQGQVQMAAMIARYALENDDEELLKLVDVKVEMVWGLALERGVNTDFACDTVADVPEFLARRTVEQ